MKSLKMPISKRKIINHLFFFLLILLFNYKISFSQNEPNYYSPECNNTSVLIYEFQDNALKARISRDESFFCQSIEIIKDGMTVFRETEFDAHYSFGDGLDKNLSPLFKIGNTRVNYFIFSKWTGGAHCCFSLYLLNMNDLNIQVIEGGNFHPELVDLDSDNIPEIEVLDDFLAYQFSSFASSAIGKIIFKFSNNTYEVDADLMLKPAPNLATYEKLILKWQQSFRDEETGETPPPDFMQEMTDLVFSGNNDTALQLLDASWPKNLPGKDKFWSEYEELLNESRYYLEFENQL